VAVVDEEAGEFVFVAASGDSSELVGARFRTSKGLAGRVLATGESVAVADAAAHPEFAREIAIATGYEPGAIAVAPITVDGRVSAVLTVLDPAGPIGPETLACLSKLAVYGAAGLKLAAGLEAGPGAPDGVRAPGQP